MAVLSCTSFFSLDAIYTQPIVERVYMRKCVICNLDKKNSEFYHLRNGCKQCLNLRRISTYKNSVCRHCNKEFRPGIRGRYKFCSETCRFMDKVKKDDSGCWLWQGGIHKDGYGYFVPEGGRSGLAHRASYRLFKDAIKNEMLILHSCHVPSCVNPDHLRQGTNADNARDKSIALRGNQPKGENAGMCKLTEGSVIEIRNKAKEGLTYISISQIFNISSTQVSNIVRRLSWKHVI